MKRQGVETTMVSYSSVINACAKAGKYERAEHWLEEMKWKGYTTKGAHYDQVIA